MDGIVQGYAESNISETIPSSNITYTEYAGDNITYPLQADDAFKELYPGVYTTRSYIYILWYIIGLPANTVAFLTWIQRQMINSSGCYMAALALTDNLFLLMHVVVITAGAIWFTHVGIFNHPVLCQMLPVIYTAAQFMSGSLILAFTIEQYIAICHPFKRSQYCRVSIAKKVILIVTITVLALSSPQAYFFTLYDASDGSVYCLPRASILKGGTSSFWSIWTWCTEMLMFGLIPISCLILNLLVIHKLTRKTKIQLTRHFSNSTQTSMKHNKRGATTLMLLVVSLYWVFTEIPATVVLGLKQAFDWPEVYSIEEALTNVQVGQHLKYFTARTIIELICFSRYSCKLFLYLATGKQFRRYLLKSTFTCSKHIQSRWGDKSLSAEESREVGTEGATPLPKNKLQRGAISKSYMNDNQLSVNDCATDSLLTNNNHRTMETKT